MRRGLVKPSSFLICEWSIRFTNRGYTIDKYCYFTFTWKEVRSLMSTIQTLSHQARPSLGVSINKYVKEVQGTIYKPYTEAEVERITTKVKLFYEYSKPTKQTAYYAEIKGKLSDPQFMMDLTEEVRRFLDNRPTQARYDEYILLCTQHQLTPKVIANKQKLEARIDKIISTNGETQDIK